MTNQQRQQLQQQPQQEKQQQRIVSHLNNDIYNNGLKFERDRTFKNKLIVKVILIMALLLIVIAVLCATVVKSSSSTFYNETKIMKIYKKVPVNYNPDLEEMSTDKETSQDFKTSFVQSDLRYPNLYESQIISQESYIKSQKRFKRQHSIENNLGQSNRSSSLLKKTSLKKKYHRHIAGFEAISLGGSDPTEMMNENETINEEPLKKNRKDVTQVQFEKDEFEDRYKNISLYWKEEMDEEKIRMIQAEKMLSYMDTTADPCENFYQYACGNWEKKNPIPEDKANSDTFEILRESLDSILRDLLMEPTENDTSEAVKKAKDLFESCMNEKILEERGNEPLYNLSKSLNGWPMILPDWDDNSSNFNWLELVAKLKLFNNDILVAMWVRPDIKNSAQYIIQFDQTSLGLPSRDYFLELSNSVYLEAYRRYIVEVALLLGGDKETVVQDVQNLIQFEIKLANITTSVENRRNVTGIYNKMPLFSLKALVPKIDWFRYLNIVLNRTIEPDEKVVVYALKYFIDLTELIEKTPSRTIANYIMWRFMRHRVNYLGKKFQDARQNFYFALFGREKNPSRWSICISQINSNMGMALGSMFVRRYFDESSKNDTISMTQDIMNAFKDTINATDWINPETKKFAQNKVDAMNLRIGYPDFILDVHELNEYYHQVNISKSLYFENILNLIQYLAKVEMNRLNTTVNRTHWNTPPAVVNAYYSGNKNQIMFPAGILQPPFYHKYFPKSLNYGGIGIVIGHEITHGFDDRGRLFDQHGNLDQWWDEVSITEFHHKAKCLIDQYSSYKVKDIDTQIDGVLTQGENIADNGGIKQAFKAYEKWLEANNFTDSTLPGLNATNYQLFFLNFAQVWCESIRPEASRNKLKTEVHSPGSLRVMGTLSNSEDFAKAYNCGLNTAMNPAKKCKIW